MNSKVSTKSSIFKWLGIMVTIAMVVTNLSVLAGALPVAAHPDVTVTPGTGGTGISIDTESPLGNGAWSADLSSFIIQEGSTGDILGGDHTIHLPSGWEFDTGRACVVAENGSDLVLSRYTILPDLTSLIFHVNSVSTTIPARLTFSFLRIRPYNLTTLSSGSMYYTGAGIAGVTPGPGGGATDFGDVSSTFGTLHHMDVTGPGGSVTAGSAFDITVKAADQFDNTVTSFTGTVHFVSTDPHPASLLSNTAFDAAWNGVHTFTGGVTLYTTPSQTITVNDVGTGKTGTSAAITVQPAAAATLTFSRAPLSGGGTVDSPLATQPIIQVVDTYGNNVADNTVVTAAVEAGGHGTGSLRNTTANTSGGLATFGTLGYSKSGEAFGITFSCTTGTPLNTSGDLAAMTPGVKNKLDWGTQPATSVLSTATWTTFTVKIEDYYGNQTTDTDSVLITPSVGTLGGTTSQPAVSGLATFNDITDIVTGSLHLTATSGTLTASPASNTITVNPGDLDHFTVTGADTATVGDAGHQLTITAYDSNGNLKTDYTGDKSLTFSGANTAPLGAAPSVSDTSTGNITFSNPTVIHFTSGVSDAGGLLKLYKAELAHVAAHQGGAGTPTTLDVTVSPAAAATLTFSRAPLSGGGTVDSPLATQPIIQVVDTYGNNVADNTVVTAAVEAGGHGTGSLRNTTANTSGGLATFGTLGYSKSGEAFGITFSCTTGTPLNTSGDLAAMTPGVKNKLDWGTQPATSVLSTATWTTFTVKIEDYYGNQTTDTDSVLITPSVGTLGGTTSQPAVSGLATFNDITDIVTGSLHLTATSGTLTASPASNTITVNPGDLDHFTVTVPGSAAAGVAATVTVTADDANGNIKTDYTGTVTLSSDDVFAKLGGVTEPSWATYTFTSGGGLDNGVHDFRITFFTIGSKTVTATDGTVHNDSSGINVTPGTAYYLKITAGSGTMTAGVSQTITISAYDQWDNLCSSGPAIYEGPQTLTFSGLSVAPDGAHPTVAGTNLGTSQSITFTAGQATATLSAFKAETGMTLNVADTVNSINSTGGNGLGLTISANVTTHYVFTSPARTLTAGVTSTDNITVQRRDAYENPNTTDVTVTLTPTSSSTGTYGFRDTGDTTDITSVDITNGTDSASFKYWDEKAGSPQIGVPGVSQTETVNANDAVSVNVETLANGTGTTVGPASVEAGPAHAITVYAITRDTYGNFVANVAADAWSLPTKTGVVDGDLVPVTGNMSAVFTGHLVGTATIRAMSGALTVVDSNTVTVTPALAETFTISAVTTTPTAGAGDNLTITAYDHFGNVVTAYNGNYDLSFTGATTIGTYHPTILDRSSTNISFGSTTSLSFVSGVANTSVTMKLYKAEIASIAAADSTNGVSTPLPLSVTVSPSTTYQYNLNSPADITAGGARAAYTVSRTDTYGNTVISGTDTVNLAYATNATGGTYNFSSDSGGGSIVTSVDITDTHSTADFYFYSEKAGNFTITAGGTSVDGTDMITVATAAIAHYSVSSVTDPEIAGTSFSVTIQAQDAFNNNITSGGSAAETVNITKAVADAGATPTSVVTASGIVTFTMTMHKTATSQQLTFTGATSHVTGVSNTFDVNPGAAAYLAVTGSATMTAGTTNELTVAAYDAEDNLCNSGVNDYDGSYSLIFSGPAVIGSHTPNVEGTNVGSSMSVTFSHGITSGSNLTLTAYKAGTSIAVHVDDGAISSTGHDLDLTVNPDVADHLTLVKPAADPTAGTAFNFVSLTANDQFGNTATSYSGDKTIAWSQSGAINGPDGTLDSYTTSVHFTAGVASTALHTTLYRAQTAKNWTADDAGLPHDVANVATANFNVKHAAADHLVLAAPAGPQTAGASFDFTSLIACDAYGNYADNANFAAAYSGTHTISWSHTGTGDGPDGTPDSYTTSVDFGTNGVATTALTTTLYRAQGGITVTAAGDGLVGTNVACAAFDVKHGVANHTVLVAPAGSQTAGSAFNFTSITVVDTWGNVADGAYGAAPYNNTGDTVDWTMVTGIIDGPTSGIDTYTTSVDFTNGVSTTTLATTLYRAQTGVTVTGDISTLGNNDDVACAAFTVLPGILDSFTVATQHAGTETAGTHFSVTSTAYDAYGNLKTDYTGLHNVSFSSNATASPNGTAADIPSGASDEAFVTGVFTKYWFTLYNAGETPTITITETVGSKTGTTAAITVHAAATTALYFWDSTIHSVATIGTQVAGTSFSVKVAECDAYGNLDTTKNGDVITVSGGTPAPSAALAPWSNAPHYEHATVSSGIATIGGNILYRAESGVQIVADDGVHTEAVSNTFNVQHAATGSFEVTKTAPDPVYVGDNVSVSVTAIDTYGNIMNNANGASPFHGTIYLWSDATNVTWHTQIYVFSAANTTGIKDIANIVSFSAAQTGVVITVDNFDATVEGSTTPFDVLGLTPEISSHSPTGSGAAIDATPTVTFDRAMDQTTVNPNTVQLRLASDNSIINSTVTYSGTVATIHPVSNLNYSTAYYLWVSGAKDTVGRTLDTVSAYTDGTYSFTTVADNRDVTAPAFTSITPNTVQTSGTFTITANVTEANALTGYMTIDGVPVAATVGGAAPSQTITFNAVGLTTGTHVVYVKGTDAAGNWNATNFNVVVNPNASDVTAPAFTSITPTTVQTSGTFTITANVTEANALTGYMTIDGVPVAATVGGAAPSQTITFNAVGLTTGTHVVYVKGTDAAGNWNATNFNVVVNPNANDVTAPVLSGIGPTTIQTTGSVNPVVFTFADETAFNAIAANNVIQFTMDGATVAGVPVVSGAGNTTLTITYTNASLAVGTHNFNVRVKDNAGNSTTAAASVTVAALPGDVTPPTIVSIVPNTVQTTGSVNPVVFTFADETAFNAIAANNVIQFTMDGATVAGVPVVSGAGNTTLTITYTNASLAVGTHNFNVRVKDNAGNSTTAAASVTVAALPGDVTPPTIVSIVPNTVQTTGSVNPVVFTFADETAFNAIAANNVIQFTMDGATVAGVPVVSGAGNTTLTITYTNASLAVGTHNFNVRVKDNAGNSTSAAAAITVVAIADTIAPPAPAITTAPATVNAGFYMITGTATVDTTVQTIQVFNGATLAGTATVPVGQTAWATTVALTQEADNSFTATSSDVYGNTSGASTPAVVITESNAVGADTMAPPIPVITSGPATVNAATYVISGTAGPDTPNDTVRIIRVFHNSFPTLVGTATVPVGMTNWAVTVPLVPNAANTFTATSSDVYGNTSVASTAVVINEQPGAVVSNVLVSSITSTTATITWNTNVATSSNSVDYDVTYALTSNQITSTGDGVTSHSASLAGLTPNSTYYFRVQSTTVAGTVTYVGTYAFNTPAADSGIEVSIQTIKPYAIADNTYADGWEFKFDITVNNPTETNLTMKFDDWFGTGGALAALGNMKIALVDNAAGVDAGTVGVAVGNAYTDQSSSLTLVDQDPNVGGIQATIYVYVKVPVSTGGGSYSTSYGIHTQ